MSEPAELPPPRAPGRYAIALVCLGNICRSPMADVVLTRRVDEAGLSGRVTVSSCGTGAWHVGNPMDPRAAATLAAADYDPSAHRAQQFDPGWLEDNDLVLVMDRQNLEDVRAAGVSPDDGARLRMFRDFDPIGTGGDVPDPYYGGDGGFEEVLQMVERTAVALLAALQRQPDLQRTESAP